MVQPSYIPLYQTKKLEARVDEVVARLKSCRLCPRECGVDRLSGEQGFCRIGRKASVASFHPHFGEESPLVGTGGSGTIFFSSCNLRCTFCQNYEISHQAEGRVVEPEALASMMLHLAGQGCHNINFVTPTHVIPQILEALLLAVPQGLTLPLVYNSGGYDSVSALHLLDGIVDIYMPDFKFWEATWAERYCGAPHYREKAIAAIKEMHRQVGDLQINEQGIAVRGLLVRHLVMPDDVAGTAHVMNFLASELSVNTYVNIMAQYRPCGQAFRDDVIHRPITRNEFHQAVTAAREAGLKRLD